MSSSTCPAEGLRVLVVDDEELACRGLRRKLLAAGGIARVEHTTDPVQAVGLLRADPPDLLLLDVRMPGLSGFEVLAHFPEGERSFLVVFCTAHDEHATRAFEAAALDYLVKPVEPARLCAALARVRRQLSRQAPPSNEPGADTGLMRARSAGITGWLERVVVRYRNGLQVVALADVQVLSSEAHRSVAYTLNGEHVLEPSLACIEPQLDPKRFVRCHRAHIVQLRHVEAVEGDEVVLAGGRRVPVSRRCRGAMMQAVLDATCPADLCRGRRHRWRAPGNPQ